uniref:Uncharacterized protein n=1 Tax=uncultured bacterium Bio7 TaxID=460940 RepID=B2BKB6_9BACT|nr:unknown [uncultured bacterium Bio7]
MRPRNVARQMQKTRRDYLTLIAALLICCRLYVSREKEMHRRTFLLGGIATAGTTVVHGKDHPSPSPSPDGRSPANASNTPLPHGLFMRMSAQSFAGVTNGARVPAWSDLVGSVEFTQTVTEKRPSVVADAFGIGRLGVRCEGGQFMSTSRSGAASGLAGLIDSQEHTTYIVATGISRNSIGCAFGASTGGNSYFWLANGSAVGRFDAGLTEHTVPFSGPGFVSFGGTSTTDTSGGSGRGLERVYARGGCICSSTKPMPTTGSSDFSIGARGDGSQYASLTIGEVLIFDRELGPVEMLQLERWVCEQYGQPYPWSDSEFLIFLGDSQTSGVGAWTTVGTLPYALAVAERGRLLGQWSNLGIGGISWNDPGLGRLQGGQMHARLTKDVFGTAQMLGFAPKYVVGEFSNSRAESNSQLVGYALSYLRALKGDVPIAVELRLANVAGMNVTRPS